jgi:putative Mg2+ transporter-C (MgtC) family protein
MISEFEMIMKLLIALALGGVIGFEREAAKRPAGLRTHILVCTSSTILTILSFNAFPGADPARIASNIIVGMGFIGAGCIVWGKRKVVGITTAASLWMATAIGITIGVGYYSLAVVATIIAFLVLRLKSIEESLHD